MPVLDTTPTMSRDDLQAIDRQIGQNIKAARQRLNLSQTDLGKACGVSFQQVQKYEVGSNRVAGSRLVQIARRLGVSAASLLEVI